MPGIEADADVNTIKCIKDPEDIAGLTEEEVRQFIFQHAADTEETATFRDAVEDGDRVFHALEAFVVGRNEGAFGPGMNDEVMNLKNGGGVHGMKYGLSRALPRVWIGRGNIEASSEGSVKGICLHTEFVDPFIGPVDRGKIAIVEMSGG